MDEEEMVLRFEKTIERMTGEKIEDIRNEPVSERQARIESSTGQALRAIDYTPWFGRGNVMHDRVETTQEVNEGLDVAYGDD